MPSTCQLWWSTSCSLCSSKQLPLKVTFQHNVLYPRSTRNQFQTICGAQGSSLISTLHVRHVHTSPKITQYEQNLNAIILIAHRYVNMVYMVSVRSSIEYNTFPERLSHYAGFIAGPMTDSVRPQLENIYSDFRFVQVPLLPCWTFHEPWNPFILCPSLEYTNIIRLTSVVAYLGPLSQLGVGSTCSTLSGGTQNRTAQLLFGLLR